MKDNIRFVHQAHALTPGLRHAVTLGLLGLLFAGCQPKSDKPTATNANFDRLTLVEMTNNPDTQNTGRDAQAIVPVLVQMDVYRLSLASGTISRNDAFWKRVDETCVDVATHDLLDKNGIRVGVAPIGEWDYFAKLMEKSPPDVKHQAFIGSDVSNVELTMDKDVRTEDIFFFDNDNVLTGRTYDNCENVIRIYFRPEPRRPGEVFVEVGTVVRSLRKKLEYTALNTESEIQYYNPEHVYAGNLRADVPLKSFMIVSPTGAANAATSIGSVFLTKDGTVGKQEEVLLLVPKPYEVKKNGAGKTP